MMLYVHDAQGHQRGPFDAATIVAMLQRGEMDDRALCCAVGETQWVNVRAHPAIAAIAEIAAQPSEAESNASKLSWGVPAMAWSLGWGVGGSTWGPTNSVPPSAGVTEAEGTIETDPQGAAMLTSARHSASSSTGTIETDPLGAAIAAQHGAPAAGLEEEAAEDAALGIPVEVTKPPSVAPATVASTSLRAATGQGVALHRVPFVSGATTSEVLEAKRAARVQEGRARTKRVVGSMVALGVIAVGMLAALGWTRRRVARQELARASVAQGQVRTSELRGDALQVDFAPALGTTVRGPVESNVRCVRVDAAANVGLSQGERHERWSCDVSRAPFGSVQLLRFTLAAEHGTSEVLVTYTRPFRIEVTRDAATGTSRIVCRGVHCEGTFDGRSGLVLTVPARTMLWLGGEQHESATDGELRVPLRWDALFASVPTTELFVRDGVVPVELRLRIPGAPTMTTRLELLASVARQVLFRQWRAGQPVLFPGEVVTGAERRTIVAQHGEVFGRPQQLRDIDLLAFVREQIQTKVCRYTVAPRERRTITLRRVDAVLTVFERRTARAIGTRRFNAPWAECPAQFTEAEVPTTRFDEESVRRWLRSFVGA